MWYDPFELGSPRPMTRETTQRFSRVGNNPYDCLKLGSPPVGRQEPPHPRAPHYVGLPKTLVQGSDQPGLAGED